MNKITTTRTTQASRKTTKLNYLYTAEHKKHNTAMENLPCVI
jgi:hypothetical protein